MTREENAASYIKEHRIKALMNQLAESLIYKQPIDPRGHLIEVLEEMVDARERQVAPSGLLDESNINAIFGLIDVMGKETVALRDALSALEKVGITSDIFGVDPVPKDVFVKRTKEVLEEQQANYIQQQQH